MDAGLALQFRFEGKLFVEFVDAGGEQRLLGQRDRIARRRRQPATDLRRLAGERGIVDINPLFVRAAGEGAAVADALLKVSFD